MLVLQRLTRSILAAYYDLIANGHVGTHGLYRRYLPRIFDTGTGTTLATIILFIWILFPLWLSVRSFAKKDL